MFFSNKPAMSTGDRDEVARSSIWQVFKNLGEMASDLGHQVSAFITTLSQLHFSEPVRVEFRDGQLYLDDQPQALHGPETRGEASQVWSDIAREFARDAELLAERLDG